MTTWTTVGIQRAGSLDVDVFARDHSHPGVPVVLAGAAAGWPALTRWSHEWLGTAFGDRTVEVTDGVGASGRRRTTTLGAYIEESSAAADGDGTSYLRQHPLHRIPELRADIAIPPYVPPGRQVVVNLWIGPAGTIQPFHKDNHNSLAAVHNLLVQVCGRKVVSLVSADHDDRMYPDTTAPTTANYSQVDLADVDLDRFPGFEGVTVSEAVIGPGDMVFIPADTWHHVRSLEPSISVSFWWYRTFVADVVASLAAPDASGAGAGLGPAASRRIDEDDVEEVGGIWALVLAARSLPDARRPLLAAACTDAVAGALEAGLAAFEDRR